MDDLTKSAVKNSDLSKATGEKRFPSDIYRGDYATGIVVRSPLPRCLVKRIDTSEAMRVSGVYAVITAEDIPGLKTFGKEVDDMPILIGEGQETKSVLDALCLIAAENEEKARVAADAIEMDLEERPGVYSPEEAMSSGAPKIHPSGNVVKHFKIRHGNPQVGFEEADCVVENTYSVPAIDHAFMETEAAFAEPTKTGIRIFVGSQNPYLEQELAASVLDLPEDQVEVVDVGAGGGFGGKDDGLITLFVALLAWKTNKPIRMVWNRQESLQGHTKRHPMKIQAKTGAKENGKITAMEMEIVADTGAYAHWGPSLLSFASLGASGVYEIPNVWVDTCVVYTNNIMSGAMRSWGNQAIAFVVESQVDRLSSALDIHPLRFRWLNALQEGSMLISGRSAPTGVGVRRTIEAAAEKLGIDLNDPKQHKSEGIGFASVMQGVNYHFGHEDSSEVTIRVNENDVFEIYAVASDIGQGFEAEIRLIFSRSMGDLPIEQTRWMPRNTATSPNAGATGASRHTALTGNAVWGAGRRVRSKIIEIAAEMMGTTPDKVQFKHGQLWSPDRELNLSEVLQKARDEGVELKSSYQFVAPPTTPLDDAGQGYPINQYSYETQFVEVDVDTDTGAVDVKRVVGFIDAGRIVNPLGAKMQSEGGTVMGLGYALMEEFKMREGRPTTDSLATFLIPTIKDVPPEIETHFVGEPISFGYLGARGLAEIVMVPATPALLNAIYDAVGVRINQIPATPERVLLALEERKS